MSRVTVEIENRSSLPLDTGALAGTAERILAAVGIDGGELGLIFVGEQEMESLNRRHMGREGVTDVLAFPIDAPEAGGTGGEAPLLLGDVIICPEVAAAQAAGAGETTARELCLLLVHGILHLTGADHERDQGEMEATQRRLFEQECRRYGEAAGE